jgi:hypothetical protein
VIATVAICSAASSAKNNKLPVSQQAGIPVLSLEGGRQLAYERSFS